MRKLFKKLQVDQQQKKKSREKGSKLEENIKNFL